MITRTVTKKESVENKCQCVDIKQDICGLHN